MPLYSCSNRGWSIRAVLLDYDGVLMPYWPRMAHLIPNILKRLNLGAFVNEIDIETLRQFLFHDSIGRALFTMIPTISARHDRPVPTKETMIGALVQEEMSNNPVPFSGDTWHALRILKQWRDDPQNDLSFLGIVSDRTYSTAMHHMESVQHNLFALVDVIQFSRAQEEKRREEQQAAEQRQRSCDIRIQHYRKPDARSFANVLRWVKKKEHLKGATVDKPFYVLYVGDTTLDANAIQNANILFQEQGIPVRLLFVPAAISGPIRTYQEWRKTIGKPIWATPPVFDMSDVLYLLQDYRSGLRTIPDLR